MTKLEETVKITNAFGLHARASVKLAHVARQFASDIAISRGTDPEEVDGKNVLSLLTLGAEKGHVLRIRVEGNDAETAMNAVLGLINGKFDEH